MNEQYDYPPEWDEPELEECPECGLGLMHPDTHNEKNEGSHTCEYCGFTKHYNYMDHDQYERF